MSTTITIQLQKGWNWISLNMILDDMSINNYLSNILEGQWSINDQIKNSQNQFSIFDNGQWATDTGLDTIDIKKMYKIYIHADSISLSVSGRLPYRGECELPLIGGDNVWNWLPYPLNENKLVNDVFSTTFSNNDYLLSQDEFSSYSNEEWKSFGSLTTMNKNTGYAINTNTDVVIEYPDLEEEDESLDDIKEKGYKYIFKRTFQDSSDSIYPFSTSDEDYEYNINEFGLTSTDASNTITFSLPEFYNYIDVDNIYIVFEFGNSGSCSLEMGNNNINYQMNENNTIKKYTIFNSDNRTSIILRNIINLKSIALYNSPSKEFQFENNVYKIEDTDGEIVNPNLENKYFLVPNHRYKLYVIDKEDNICVFDDKLIIDSVNYFSYKKRNEYMYISPIWNGIYNYSQSSLLFVFQHPNEISLNNLDSIQIQIPDPVNPEQNVELAISSLSSDDTDSGGEYVKQVTYQQSTFYCILSPQLHNNSILLSLKLSSRGGQNNANSVPDYEYSINAIIPQYFKTFIKSVNISKNIDSDNNPGYNIVNNILNFKAKKIRAYTQDNLSMYDKDENYFEFSIREYFTNYSNEFDLGWDNILIDTEKANFLTLNNLTEDEYVLLNQILAVQAPGKYANKLQFNAKIDFNDSYYYILTDNATSIKHFDSEQTIYEPVSSIEDLIYLFEVTLKDNVNKKEIFEDFIENEAVFYLYFDNLEIDKSNLGHNYEFLYRDSLVQSRMQYRYPNDFVLIANDFNPAIAFNPIIENKTINDVFQESYYTGESEFIRNQNYSSMLLYYNNSSQIVKDKFFNDESIYFGSDGSFIQNNISSKFHLRIKRKFIKSKIIGNGTFPLTSHLKQGSELDLYWINRASYDENERFDNTFYFSSNMSNLGIADFSSSIIDGNLIKYNNKISRTVYSTDIAHVDYLLQRLTSPPQVINITSNSNIKSINVLFTGPHFNYNMDLHGGSFYSFILTYSDLKEIYNFNTIQNIEDSFGFNENVQENIIFFNIKNFGLVIEYIGNTSEQESIITIGVAPNSNGNGNVYVIDGVQNNDIVLKRGIYKFIYPNNHPIRFSETYEGDYFTTNVSSETTFNNDYLQTSIELTYDTPSLYYFCQFHSGMGGTLSIKSREDEIEELLFRELGNIYHYNKQSDIVTILTEKNETTTDDTQNIFKYNKVNKNESIYNEQSVYIKFERLTFSSNDIQTVLASNIPVPEPESGDLYRIENLNMENGTLDLILDMNEIILSASANGFLKAGQIKLKDIIITSVIPDTFINNQNNAFSYAYINSNYNPITALTDLEYLQWKNLSENTIHNSNTVFFISSEYNGINIINNLDTIIFKVSFSTDVSPAIINGIIIDSSVNNNGSGNEYNKDNIPSTSFYKIKLNFDGDFSHVDVNIIEDAANTWSNIITSRILPDSDFDMKINIHFEKMASNVLGSAGPTYYTVKNGNYIPTEGDMTFNTLNWNIQKNDIKKNGKNEAFYTVLHEIGHVLGIGTMWNFNNLVSTDELWYRGTNALREYRNYNNNQTLVAIPIEDNGGGGTAYGHPEEGDSTQANRYNDGKLHPGLDTELMTGYAEGTNNPDPLSRITVGFLHDIGFEVDYDRSDDYVIN